MEMWQHVVKWFVCCLMCRLQSAQRTAHKQALYKLLEDGRRPKHVGKIIMCIFM